MAKKKSGFLGGDSYEEDEVTTEEAPETTEEPAPLAEPEPAPQAAPAQEAADEGGFKVGDKVTYRNRPARILAIKHGGNTVVVATARGNVRTSPGNLS